MEMITRSRLVAAWSTMFLVGTELFVFSPLLPLLAADYHISIGVAGLVVTIFSLTYMTCAPLLGHVSDRIGRRRILSCALLVFAAANLLTALVANLPSLLAVRLCAGASAAGISPSIYALVGQSAPPDRRGTWLAVAASGLLVSLALGASAGAIAIASFGWPTIFVALAGLSLALAWLNRRVWPGEPGVMMRSSATTIDRRIAAALARRLIPMALWSTGLYGVYTYLGAGLIAVGFTTGHAAWAILCYGGGAIAGVFIGGHVTDRLGVKFTAGVSFAGLCACLLILRVALDTGTLVEPVISLSSAVAQLFFPAQQVGLANDFPRQRGAALAWNNSALFFGISLGSAIGGQAVALGSFDLNLTISAGIALIGWFVTAIVVPDQATDRDRPRQ
jgi:MFS transporter, DHA1 family, putative efflux transporter